nr:DNA internalization-related competence protein ComEC/Rec2 [Derxia gummosa]
MAAVAATHSKNSTKTRSWRLVRDLFVNAGSSARLSVREYLSKNRQFTSIWLSSRLICTSPGEADWALFSRVGISHLLAISGLHITMLAALAGWLARRWWKPLARWAPALAEWMDARGFAAWTGLAVAGGYVLLAGFAVPAQRTLAMLAVVALARAIGVRPRAGRVLAVALVAVLAWDPWAVRAAGFWLSFVAVAVLMFAAAGQGGAEPDPPEAAGGRPRRDDSSLAPDAGPDRLAPPGAPARLRAAVALGSPRAVARRGLPSLLLAARLQLAISVALAPLTLFFFQSAPVIGPVANALAIPLVSYAVTPLALLGGLAGAATGWEAPLHLAHALFGWLAGALDALAAPRWASAELPAPAAWAAALAIAGLGWLALPRGVPARAAGALFCAPLLLVTVAPPADGQLRLTAIDIGQGTAVLVETAHHRLLYDTGPRYGSDGDAGGRVIAPLLRALGIDRLDGLVLSHRDSDHAGGAASLLARVDAGWLLTSIDAGDPVLAPVLPRLAPPSPAVARRCEAGQHWRWDGADFTVLHPAAADYARERSSNQLSCVLRIEAGGEAVLLTGDIDAESERELLVRGAPLAASLLLVAHHGSRTSSSPEFLAATGARLAVVQAGWRNRFGHPRAEVLDRLRAAGMQMLRSDDSGAITLETGASGWRAITEREARPAYWRDR